MTNWGSFVGAQLLATLIDLAVKKTGRHEITDEQVAGDYADFMLHLPAILGKCSIIMLRTPTGWTLAREVHTPQTGGQA